MPLEKIPIYSLSNTNQREVYMSKSGYKLNESDLDHIKLNGHEARTQVTCASCHERFFVFKSSGEIVHLGGVAIFKDGKWFCSSRCEYRLR